MPNIWDPTGWWNGAFFAGYLPMIVGIVLREKLKPTGSGTAFSDHHWIVFCLYRYCFCFSFFVAAILGNL